jgi:hypothetical protein
MSFLEMKPQLLVVMLAAGEDLNLGIDLRPELSDSLVVLTEGLPVQVARGR